MKRLFLLCYFFVLSNNTSAQENKPVRWEEVMLTNNTEDTKGLKKIKEIESKSSKPFGTQKKLRSKAVEKIKKEASKIGASVVFIQMENFSFTPINNYYIVGIAYKEVE